MKKLLISILCTIPLLLSAQSQVTGVVFDSNKEPLVGVNVVVRNSNTGTITNPDGKFSIKATSKDSLVFSYIGYQKITLKATPSVETLSIILLKILRIQVLIIRAKQNLMQEVLLFLKIP